jgi:hypothetical protein
MTAITIKLEGQHVHVSYTGKFRVRRSSILMWLTGLAGFVTYFYR